MTPCLRCEGGKMAVERDPVHGDIELVCLACGHHVYEPEVIERSLANAARPRKQGRGSTRMFWETAGKKDKAPPPPMRGLGRGKKRRAA